MKTALGLALALTLVGAASSAQEAAPTVSITLTKGFNSNIIMLHGGETIYTLYDGADCTAFKRTESLIFTGPKTRDITARAGDLVVITAQTTLSPLEAIEGSAPDHENECMDSVAFKAEPGHRYQVTHRARQEGCRMLIVDKTTNAAPASARTVRGLECKAFLDPSWVPPKAD